METQLNKNGNGSLSLIQTDAVLKQVEEFTQKLNCEPVKAEVRINKMANNSKYLPISFVQMKLDEIFFGLWETEIQHVQVVANEIIGYGTLRVYHPIAKTWIKRSGSAAVMIQQVSKEKGGSGDITNIRDKIKNTLVKDFPHLEAEIIKSAARKFGKMFGRDLNREFADDYTPFSEDLAEEPGLNEELDKLSDHPKCPSAVALQIKTSLHQMDVDTKRRTLEYIKGFIKSK